MKTTKRQKIHNWVTIDNLTFLKYRCTRCKFETLPGVPLPMPQKEQCL